MADAKISDLTAATSANSAMLLEVEDSGASKKATLSQLNNPAWQQIGSTVTFSGQTDVTLSSIPACNELMIELEGLSFPDQGYDYYQIYATYSVDGGSNYLCEASAELAPKAYNGGRSVPPQIQTGLIISRVNGHLARGYSFVNGMTLRAFFPDSNSEPPGSSLYLPGAITNIKLTGIYSDSVTYDETPLPISTGTAKLYGR